MRENDTWRAVVVSGSYALLSTGWIVGGYALTAAVYQPGNAALFELFKGLGFVAISALFVFSLLRWWHPRPAEVTFGSIAAEFRQSIRRGNRTLRWLPYGTALTLIFLMTILMLGLWSVRERTLDAGEHTIAALRSTAASQIGATLTSVELALDDVAKDLRQGELIDGHKRLQSVQSSLQPLVRAVWVLDSDGRIVTDSDTGNLGFDLSARDYFVHHRKLANSGFFLGAPVRSYSTGTWFVSASVPVRASDGALMGVVVAALDLKRFADYWDSTLRDSAIVVTLLRDDGTVLMRSPFSEPSVSSTADAAGAWLPLLSNTKSEVFRAKSTTDGTDHIYGYGIVAAFPSLRAIVELPASALLAGWVRLATVGLTAYLVVLGLVGMAVVQLLGQLRERIASQRLAASLARYPLNSINPVMTISSTGERRFLNDAAQILLKRVEGTEESRALDESLVAMVRKATPGESELFVEGHSFAASYLPNGDDTSDIYLIDITSLRQGESMLRLFFDLPFIGMALTSPETKRWVKVNDKLCEILGYPREELLGLTWAEITHPDDLGSDVTEFERVLAGALDGYVMGKRFLRKDGAIVHAMIDVKAMRDPQGKIMQFLATIQDITNDVQSRNMLTRQRDIYAALSDTNHAIVISTSRNEIFQAVCTAAVELAGLRFAWIGMIDAEAGTLNPVARYGEDHGYIDVIGVSIDANAADGQGPGGRAAREGRHQIVHEIAYDPMMAPWQAAVDRAGVRAVAAFPLMRDRSVVGVFCVYAAETDFFDNDVVALLDEMARDLSFALVNIEREQARTTALAELANAEARFRRAIEEAPFPVLIHAENGEIVTVSRAWTDVSGYTREDIPDIATWTELAYGSGKASVKQEISTLYDLASRRDEGEYSIRCKDGSMRIWAFSSVSLGRLSDGRRVAMSMAADVTELKLSLERVAAAEASYRGIVEQSLVGILLVDRTTVLYSNQRAAEILGYKTAELAGLVIERLVSAGDLLTVQREVEQVLSGGKKVGSFEFRVKRDDGREILVGAQGIRARSEDKPSVLAVMQDITEKRQAELEIRFYIERLRDVLMSTVNLATNLGEMRDPYTAGHAARVAMIAVAIGEELGLDNNRVEGLRVAGLLHDIGKIMVPSELLSRPGKLMPAEFELIKYHAQAGYDVLKGVDFSWPAAKVALQHHERIDGSGYPQGLRGDAICLEARIMAVADVVEAIASHRPYRPGLGIARALEEIERGRGTIFDPEVADACLRLFREKHFILPPA